MRILDVFPARNEYSMIRSRITELADFPDVAHIAVEATTTHSGLPKPLYLKESGFEADRLHIYSVDLPHTENPWIAEEYQRDVLLHIVEEKFQPEPDDLILSCDADEIVDGQAIDRILSQTQRRPAKLSMKMLWYGATFQNPVSWSHAAACRWKSRPNTLSDLRLTWKGKDVRGVGAVRMVPDAGWHVSWHGDAEWCRQKLTAFAHQELNTPDMLASMEKRITEGIDTNGVQLEPFNREHERMPKGL